MIRPVVRPVVLLAVLVPLHLAAQRLLLGHIVLPLIAFTVLAVLAYEVIHRLVSRRGHTATPPV